MDYAIAVEHFGYKDAQFTREKTYQDLADTWTDVRPIPSDAQLIAAFADWETEQDQVAIVQAIQAGAEAQAAAIPGFATWTEQEGLDWIDDNIGDTPIDAITNLAEAKALMKKQATSINALWRVSKSFLNHTWPDLEGS